MQQIGIRIQQYLQGPKAFLPGLELLKEVAPKAYQALSRYATAPIIRPEVMQQLITALQPYAVSGNTTTTEPPAIRELRREGIALLKRYADLKGRLRAAFDDPAHYTSSERHAIAREIMEDVLPATDAVYDRIRAYEQTGELPVASSTEVVRQTVQQFERLLALRSKASRLRRSLEAQPANAAELQTKLAAVEAECKNLENELYV